jgi:outer membrane protein
MKYFVGQLSAICLLLIVSPASKALDLAEIYDLAKSQDVQLMIAQSQYQSAQLSLPQAQSANRPQVNLSAHTTYNDTGNSNALVQDDTKTSYGYSLSLSQNLYNSETSSQIDAVEATVRKAEAEYKAAEQDLIIRVTEAYFNILSAQDTVAFAGAEKNAIGRQLEQAKKRFEVGLIAITDVKEAQASYDASVASEISANNSLDNAREALQLIIGQPLDAPLSTIGDSVQLLIPQPADRNAWIAQAQKNNLTLMSAEAALQAASENRKVAQSGNKPTVNLIASYTDNEIDSDNSGNFNSDDLTLSVQLKMPLYTGGYTSSNIDQAEANFRTAQNSLMFQKRTVTQLTSTAYLAIVSGISQVNALEQALASSTAALEATQAGFDVGTRTSVEVLNSLRETYRSKRDYASARYNYLVNTLKLKQAAGLLNDEDLKAINQWLVH